MMHHDDTRDVSHSEIGDMSEYNPSKRQKILSNEILIGIRKDASKELTKRLDEGHVSGGSGHRYQRLSENERKYREMVIQQVLDSLEDRLSQVDTAFITYLREEFLVKKFGDWKRSKRADGPGFGAMSMEPVDMSGDTYAHRMGAYNSSFPSMQPDDYRHEEPTSMFQHSMIDTHITASSPSAGAGNRQYIFDNSTPSNLSFKDPVSHTSMGYGKSAVSHYHPVIHSHMSSQARLVITQQPISQVIFRDRQIYAPYVVKLESSSDLDYKIRGKVKAHMVFDRPNSSRVLFDERELSQMSREAVFENIIVRESKVRRVLLEFTLDISIGNETYTIVSDLSSALVVITHSMQWPDAAREAFMHDAFKNENQMIEWGSIRSLFNKHFAKATGQTYDSPKRLLNESDLTLIKKLFCEPQSEMVTTSSFQKGWGWFGPVLYSIHKEKNKTLWFDGVIAGFLSSDMSCQILEQFPPGSFLIRFSLHKTGNFVISLGEGGRHPKPVTTHILVPNETTGTNGNIADLIASNPEFAGLTYIIKLDSNSDRYVPIEKDAFISSHRTRRESLSISSLPQGYVMNEVMTDQLARLHSSAPFQAIEPSRVWDMIPGEIHRFNRDDFEDVRGSVLSTGFSIVQKILYHGKVYCLKEPAPYIEEHANSSTIYMPQSGREFTELVNKMIRSEAYVLSYIGRHKFIVPLLGIIDSDLRPGIIMEYGEIGNLRTAISRNYFENGMTNKIRICSQIAEALEHIHKMDVVHGDIRPDNILLFRESNLIVAKLADFGLASCPKLTTTCREIAFIRYSAPEVLKGRFATSKSDVYSYGMTIWSLFTREEPYTNMPVDEIIQLMDSGKHTLPMQGVPDDLDSMIKSCLTLRSDKRPTVSDILPRLSYSWSIHSMKESGQAVSAAAPPPFIVSRDMPTRIEIDSLRSTCMQIMDLNSKTSTLRDQLSTSLTQRERAWPYSHMQGPDHLQPGLHGPGFKTPDMIDQEPLRVRLNSDDEAFYNHISNLYDIFSKEILSTEYLEYWNKMVRESLIMRHQIAIYRRDVSSDPKTSPKDTVRFIIDEQPYSQVLLKCRKDDSWKIAFKNHPLDGKYSLKLLRGANQHITGVGNLKIFVTCDNKTISTLEQNCVICWQGRWGLQTDSQTITVDVDNITIREQKVRKICMHFCVEVVVEGKRIQILSDPSNPMLLITHSSQWPDAFRDIVIEESFVHKDVITFETLANVITRHFLHSLSTYDDAPDRPITREELEFIHHRKFESKSTIGREKFLSFWIYFGALMSTLRKERIRKLWAEGLIFAFADTAYATEMLMPMEQGTAMARLSSSKPGGLVISIRRLDAVVHIMIHPDKLGYRKDIFEVIRSYEFTRLLINSRPSHFAIRREYLTTRFANIQASQDSSEHHGRTSDDFSLGSAKKKDAASRSRIKVPRPYSGDENEDSARANDESSFWSDKEVIDPVKLDSSMRSRPTAQGYIFFSEFVNQ